MALDTNLISYYKLDSNSNDSVGTNNGTDTNVSYISGKIGNAGSFNGTSTILAPASDIFWTQPVTISCWIKPTALPTWVNLMMPITFVESTVDNWAFDKSIDFDSSWNVFFRIFDWASKNISISGALSAWNWCHIVWVYDWTNIKIYANNTASWTTAVSGTYNLTTPKIWFSWSGWGSRVRYNWLIDEVGIWSRALSASEVTELYNSGAWKTYPFTAEVLTAFFMFF